LNAQKKGNIKTVRQGLTSESPSYVFLYNHLPEFLRRVTRVFSFWLSFLSFSIGYFLFGCGHQQNAPRNLGNADTNQGDLEDVIAVYQQAIDIIIQTVIYCLNI